MRSLPRSSISSETTPCAAGGSKRRRCLRRSASRVAVRLTETVTRRVAPFVVPPELEAREPAEVRGSGRDDVRLLVTRGAHGAATHATFDELPQFFERGDLLVVNVSATVPSALNARARGAGD